MAWTILAVFVLFVLPVAAIGTLLMFIRGTRNWKTWCSSTGMIIVVYLAGVATAYMVTKDGNAERQAKVKPEVVPPVVASSPPAKATEPQSPSQAAQPEPKPAPIAVTPQLPQPAPVQQPIPKPTSPPTEPLAPVNSSTPAASPAPAQPPENQPQPPTTQPPTTTTQPIPTPSQPPAPGKGPNSETIKGCTNAQGEKVYYLMGSPSFDKAVAERWFVSEDEAKKAGYKLAP